MAPWEGPRHKSWASNTVITLIAFVVILIAVVISDHFGDVPTYLAGLLGTASGALFAALGSDDKNRTAEVKQTAERAEEKADRVEAKIARNEANADGNTLEGKE